MKSSPRFPVTDQAHWAEPVFSGRKSTAVGVVHVTEEENSSRTKQTLSGLWWSLEINGFTTPYTMSAGICQPCEHSSGLLSCPAGFGRWYYNEGTRNQTDFYRVVTRAAYTAQHFSVPDSSKVFTNFNSFKLMPILWEKVPCLQDFTNGNSVRNLPQVTQAAQRRSQDLNVGKLGSESALFPLHVGNLSQSHFSFHQAQLPLLSDAPGSISIFPTTLWASLGQGLGFLFYFIFSLSLPSRTGFVFKYSTKSTKETFQGLEKKNVW